MWELLPAASGHRWQVLIEETYAAVTEAVRDLSEEELGRPTRTEWTVAELLWHQCLDAIRALAAAATVVDDEPDVDAVTYWAEYTPDQGDGGAAHAAYVRRATTAFESRRGVVDFWLATGPATARAAAAADPQARIATQGHVLRVPEFVSTLVVEATVHLLDAYGEPPAAALAETRRVLEAINGAPLDPAWDDTEAVLRGTGRLPGPPVALLG